MPRARLIIFEKKQNPRETEISGGLATIGRAPDNLVSLLTDSSVSRYHAQIEQRGENFYLSDLGSSNGTTLNGRPVQFEQKLRSDDQIRFGGGQSFVEFQLLNSTAQNSSEQAQSSSVQLSAESFDQESEFQDQKPKTENQKTENLNSPAKFPVMLTVAAVLVGFAIVSVAVVGAILWAGGGCQAEATIIDPESGATVSEATEVKINLKNSKCVDRAIYFVDGEEVGTVELAPYSFVLEPENLQKLIDAN